MDKHTRYKYSYKPNDIYWGIGIECETYLQFKKPIHVAKSIATTSHRPERYSVDYYKHSFKDGYKKDIEAYFQKDANPFVPLPLFVNSHTITKTDSKEHRLTYEKEPKLNPKFTQSLFEGWKQDPYILENYEKTFTFDGDTFEIITQTFYKTKAKKVVKELQSLKKRLLKSMEEYRKRLRFFHEPLVWAKQNPGFAVFWTNPQNVVMFNNGTYHINLTAPTLLGNEEDGIPTLANPDQFISHHKKIIRIFQWLEPFLLAMYGTPDPLSTVSDKYSKASQRCAVSRYIGIGTYDTVRMPEGKILTLEPELVRGSELPYWWYKTYHETSGYKPLSKIGMDINFRKHWNHGIELRIFDWFSEEKLSKLLRILIHCMDVALQKELVEEAVFSKDWNEFVVDVLRKGKPILTRKLVFLYGRMFDIPITPPSYNLEHYWKWFSKCVMKKKGGDCVKCML